MDWIGSLTGQNLRRRYRIGATMVKGQIVTMEPAIASRLGILSDPSTVNGYVIGLGVLLDENGVTYSTTQGTGASSAEVLGKVSIDPFQLIKGRAVGGVTAGTALAEATDGNLLTNTSASAGGTVITDADVGTSEFVGGYAIALTGQNAGQVRILTAHSDNTSTTVAVPFDYAIAVNDTFLRTPAPGNQGIELTTSFTQFNIALGAAVDLADTGNHIVQSVWVDGTTVDGDDGNAMIQSTTAPFVELVVVFADHVFNSLS